MEGRRKSFQSSVYHTLKMTGLKMSFINPALTFCELNLWLQERVKICHYVSAFSYIQFPPHQSEDPLDLCHLWKRHIIFFLKISLLFTVTEILSYGMSKKINLMDSHLQIFIKNKCLIGDRPCAISFSSLKRIWFCFLLPHLVILGGYMCACSVTYFIWKHEWWGVFSSLSPHISHSCGLIIMYLYNGRKSLSFLTGGKA